MVLGNLAVGPDCPFLFQWMCMTISAVGRLCGRKEVWQQGAVRCWKERQSLNWVEAALPGQKSGIRQEAAATLEGSRKEIALTFDDGPHPVYTKLLLDGLRERGVKATFFLIGQNLDGNEKLVRQMKEDGHLIGNHSQKHMQLTAEAVKDACSQIQWTNEKIQAITGESPQYIRPPYGSWSEELECVVPMTVILWDIDPLDWKVQDTRQIVDHVVKRVQDGNIILLHDSYETSVEAALEIIDTLSANGYNFVTADELVIE